MEAIKLASNLIDLRDAYSKLPGWKKDVEDFSPMIKQIMEEDKTDNPIKAIMPIIRKAMKENDHEVGQLILAVAVDMSINKN